MRRTAWAHVAALAFAASACATSESAAQGGAQFRPDVGQVETALPPESLFAVCWPAQSVGAVKLTFVAKTNDVMFEAVDGATNSTARCIREIATTVRWPSRPSTLTVRPPVTPASGFVVLAWVKLLASTRYGPERGLVDAAPLALACLRYASAAPRPSTRFEVTHEPGFSVHAVPSALTDSERCIEAVLSTTTWPSTRAFSLSFDDTAAAPTSAAAAAEVAFYVAPSGGLGTQAIDPNVVHDALQVQQGAVSQCWEEARSRRAGLGGARTFRFHVVGGSAHEVWVVNSATPVAENAVDYRLDSCLAKVVKSARFSADGDGVYSWVFASRAK